jgi:arylsulfatase A-like enzyme
MLLIENFTYTVLGFSAASFQGRLKYVYGLGFAALFVWIGWTLYGWVRSPRWTQWTLPAAAAGGAAVAISVVTLAFSAVSTPQPAFPHGASSDVPLPNIIILAGDGIESRRMSAFGFSKHDTTPFIRSLLPQSLVFENHFTNASNTTGAVGALLTGRLPTQTRVIYAPDVFRGDDAYQHLPAILRRLGYRNADISVRLHADAYDLNLRNGFHYANSRSLEQSEGRIRTALAIHPSSVLFLEASYDRIAGRVRHVLGIADLVNPYTIVTKKGRSRRPPDRRRIVQLLRFIDRAEEPFFAHVHLMAPHGQYYHPREQVFSKGKQKKPFMLDFYYDAIRDYDISVREVVHHLRRTGKYGRTVLVLNSDHGRAWTMHERLPLIIRLPRGEKTGRFKVNTQRVDIAPTLLDYIGAEIPDWMVGDSLLRDDLDPLRPILQSQAIIDEPKKRRWIVPQPVAPFYTLGAVGVVHCQWWYRIQLQRDVFWKGVVKQHTEPCAPDQQPDEDAVRRFLVGHLRDSGYDVSSLSE